jgi:hypothetical protein
MQNYFFHKKRRSGGGSKKEEISGSKRGDGQPYLHYNFAGDTNPLEAI